jgi:hypothetical protein
MGHECSEDMLTCLHPRNVFWNTMLWCSWIDDRPQGNLAKFGNTQDMKINNPSMLIYRNLAMSMIWFFFLKCNNNKTWETQKKKKKKKNLKNF